MPIKTCPAGSITINEAIQQSMTLPVFKGIFYQTPNIANCIDLELATELGQFIIESCFYYQAFCFVELISGTLPKEFRCDYKIGLKENETCLTKDSQVILILKENKTKGRNDLIKAIEYNESNLKIIKTCINRLKHLIKDKK